MNKTLALILAALVSTVACAQFTPDGTSKGSAINGGGSTLEIKNLAPGKAEFVITGVARRGALYCFTGVGKNWAGNASATLFDVKRMACATQKDGKAVVPVSVGDARNIPLGLLPLSVMENGVLLKWESHPDGPTLHSFVSRVNKVPGPVTLIWVNQDGVFQPASAEQAKDFSD